jgi:hypothetical protein
MLQIDLIAIQQGEHYLLFGVDANQSTSFGIQLWITKLGVRAMDWVQSLSLGWISFMGGDVWVANQPESIVPRCNFFGEQKVSYVGVVANDPPNVKKLLDSIGIYTDSEWEIESVTIPKNLNTPHGMSSKIPKNWFKRREGFLRAEFLRNMKTTSSTDSVLDLLRGEELQGNAAYILMKNVSTTQYKLYKLEINMTASKI